MNTTGREGDDLENSDVEDSGVQNQGLEDSGLEPRSEESRDVLGSEPVVEPQPEADAADAHVQVEPDAQDSLETDEALVSVRPRSAPRYGAFIGTGIIVGVILALVLYFALPSDGSTSSVTGLLYLIVLTTPFTALLGGLAAVLFERKTLRK